MNIKVHIFILIVSLLFLAYVVNKVRTNKLSERESLWWIFGGVISLIISVFPKSIDAISLLIGISYPPTFIFFIALVFLFVLTFTLSNKVSELREKNKELTQFISLMENEYREKFQAIKQKQSEE